MLKSCTHIIENDPSTLSLADLQRPSLVALLFDDEEVCFVDLCIHGNKSTLAGEAHWELLLKARAVECQCYVIAAAQAGKHNHKRESYGHSLIIDPWGRIVGKQEDPLAPGIALAPIDLGYLKAVRQKMPMDAHRKLGRTCLGFE